MEEPREPPSERPPRPAAPTSVLRHLRGYRRAWLRSDLLAGISVFVVMVPSVLAYAELAGLSSVHGLYAALAAMLGYALLASSRHVIAGPDAAIALLVGTAIGPLSGGDPGRAAVFAAVTALLVGGLMLLAAGLRIGAIADLLSKPVLVGYLTGAALILVSTQLGKLFGISLERSDFFPLLVELARRLGETHLLTLGLGAGFLLLLAALRRFLPRAPGPLVVCVAAVALSSLFDLEANGVRVIGKVDPWLPAPRFPLVTFAEVRELLPAAIGIAVLAFPEGILLARVFAAKNGYDVRPNQELRALAAANVAAGLLQGFPVGASQSRTTVNDAAGGKTQLVSVAAAGALALFLLFGTSLLRPLPILVLASILVHAGLHLVDLEAFWRLRSMRRKAFLQALIVAAGVLVIGVVPGILIGVTLSLLYLLGRLARPTDAVLREVPGTRRYHDLGETPETETVPGLIAYRFYAPLVFANANHFVERVRGLIAASPTPVRWFVLDVQAVLDVDVTAAEALARIAEEFRRQGISLKLARANRPLRERLARYGMKDLLAEGSLYGSVHAAVRAFEEEAPSP